MNRRTMATRVHTPSRIHFSSLLARQHPRVLSFRRSPLLQFSTPNFVPSSHEDQNISFASLSTTCTRNKISEGSNASTNHVIRNIRNSVDLEETITFFVQHATKVSQDDKIETIEIKKIQKCRAKKYNPTTRRNKVLIAILKKIREIQKHCTRSDTRRGTILQNYRYT